METTKTESTLSLLETTENVSMNTTQVDRDQIERLKRQLRASESENIELKRLQLLLRDIQGKDYTQEIIKLEKELMSKRDRCIQWERDYHKITEEHVLRETTMLRQIEQLEKQSSQFKRQALELEEENEKLREHLKDEKSRNFHLQNKPMNQSLDELNLRDQINASITKIQNMEAHYVQQNESFGNLDGNNADQIAAHMYMILENLDTNHQRAEELQTAIFNFLAEQGFNGNPDKCAAFANIYRDVVDKRLAEIRVGNDQLGSKVGSVAGKEFEACMQQLAQDSQISLSTTFPSYAGCSATAAFQQEMSIRDAEQEQLNATMDSVAALKLANRTSHLAEACVRMFEKLRGTAEFFQGVLKKLGFTGEELGEETMRKIESMKFDLDQSIGEALSIVDDAKIAERNLRSALAEQSQAMDSTAYSAVPEHSKVMDATEAGIEEHRTPTKECEKCKEMQVLYESVKANLDAARGKLTEMAAQLAEEENQNAKLEADVRVLSDHVREMQEEQNDRASENAELAEKVNELSTTIKELESQICELKDLYENANSALDKEIANKEGLAQQLEESEAMVANLKQEVEKLAAAKENAIGPEQRKLLIDQTREELNKIVDTMSFASSRCSSIVKSAVGKRTKGTSGSSSSSKKQPPK